jgi:hypothetical protein
LEQCRNIGTVVEIKAENAPLYSLRKPAGMVKAFIFRTIQQTILTEERVGMKVVTALCETTFIVIG